MAVFFIEIEGGKIHASHIFVGAKPVASEKNPADKAHEKSPAQAYEEWYDEQIRLGLDDIEAGRVISHEEVLKRGSEQLARLKRKYAKAA